jgi:protein-disulfide isomerase
MDERTRRQFLATSTVLCVATAGCLGDDDQSSDETNGATPEAGSDDGEATDTDGTSGTESTEDDTGTGNRNIDRPVVGSADAPVTVTVYSDFSCPHCKRFKAEVFPQLETEYIQAGDLRYQHGDLPLPVDETWSWAIASAARATFVEAGNDGFWEFLPSIFEQQGSYSYEVVETIADDAAGVGTAARTAAEEETYRDVVAADRERAREMGAEGTPTVFMDGERIEPSFSAIGDAIEQRL